MCRVALIVTVLAVAPSAARAQIVRTASDPGDDPRHGGAVRPIWRADVSAAMLVEAWDLNESRERVGGVVAGLDRAIWRGLALRADLVLLRVLQEGADAWLRGITTGVRIRGSNAGRRPFIDVAIGLSDSTKPTPPRGTRVNYLAVLGAGIEAPWRSISLTLAGRWLHVSNNGREGRHLNPDLQALGVTLGVGWEH